MEVWKKIEFFLKPIPQSHPEPWPGINTGCNLSKILYHARIPNSETLKLLFIHLVVEEKAVACGTYSIACPAFNTCFRLITPNR